ncbi:MAG: secretin N-terminal domain-containing protein [Dechloromonas sp.]|uniref:Secretin N-terminal domain-containing protein n=1 Tax=Candidatus Dechloromonas phosphorivorans TaxID=2899244 RepID=A0A9D7LQP8_9RHOO|nr:secretin N-terminal domain-containing protein [Candidatus Dechloromonas phosphorivorans]
MNHGLLATALLSLVLAACQAPTPQQPLAGHISTESTAPQGKGEIPAPVQQTLALPKPRALPKAETYSVVVNNVQVRDLLFALSRDAKVNVDIHPGITGTVSLNAINQTLPQLLTRISKQVDMRFELDGPNLAVMPDSPFLKHYKVDYVNMSRTVTGTVSTNTQINTNQPGGPGGAGASPVASGSSNVSNTSIQNNSRNMFWEQLEKNIKDILHETDKVFPEGSSETIIEQANSQTSTGAAALPQGSGPRAAQAIANALQSNPAPGSASQATGNSVVRRSTFREAAAVIMNPESGVVTVRATSRQHEKVQEFIDRVITSSRRQVLIEATIVEVQLGEGYQQGISWDKVRADGSTKFAIKPASVNSNVGTAVSPFTISFSQLGGAFDLAGMVELLQSYGTAKVLSSPRLSVMNNQTALLKVVENFVYFNVKADTTSTVNVGTTVAVTTTPQSVSVGLVMTVTPQISAGDAVILNVRPTISSISELKEDPNPSIPAGVKNYVPQIRTREIESVMRVTSGEVAVLGGLMEDGINWKTGRVPFFGQIPLIGEIFNTRNNAANKSELVIFLRPIIIRDPSLSGDYSGYRSQLPGTDFFEQTREAQPLNNFPER